VIIVPMIQINFKRKALIREYIEPNDIPALIQELRDSADALERIHAALMDNAKTISGRSLKVIEVSSTNET
jgi:hypothetical protein